MIINNLTTIVKINLDYDKTMLYIYSMKIAQKKINYYKTLKASGDIRALSALLKKDRGTVSRIINGHQGSTPETLTAIENFYKLRKKQIKSLS